MKKWKKMTSKQIIRFWKLGDMIQAGIEAGYNYKGYKIVKGEMYKQIRCQQKLRKD